MKEYIDYETGRKVFEFMTKIFEETGFDTRNLFVVCGGLGVYAYKPGEFSRDIDFLVKDEQVRDLMKEFVERVHDEYPEYRDIRVDFLVIGGRSLNMIHTEYGDVLSYDYVKETTELRDVECCGIYTRYYVVSKPLLFIMKFLAFNNRKGEDKRFKDIRDMRKIVEVMDDVDRKKVVEMIINTFNDHEIKNKFELLEEIDNDDTRVIINFLKPLLERYITI